MIRLLCLAALAIWFVGCAGDLPAATCAQEGKLCNTQVQCCDGLVCDTASAGSDRCVKSTGSTTSTTRQTGPTTTSTTTSTTLFVGPVQPYVPDTWRPDYAEVSLGSTPKHVHPRSGDYCDQRCLFLRIEKRAFDGWPMVIRYLRDVGLFDEAGKQIDATQGLPMVASEVGIENSGRELNAGGAWNFGPDYDWRGNVEGNLKRAREALVNLSRRQPITIPTDVQQFLDLHQMPGGPAVIGNPVVAARRPAVRLTDVRLRLRGLVSARVGCRPLTQSQKAALDETMRVHAENSAHRKATGQGRPGGASALMAAHEALEKLARDPDELTLFTIPAFAQTLDTTRPAEETTRLMDLEDAAHHGWARAVRDCYLNPKLMRAKAWSLGNEHTRAHLFGALYAPMQLRVSVDAPREALGSAVACTDRSLDRCPNLPFPPA